jgi:heme-degrading monooxygenase HmoA
MAIKVFIKRHVRKGKTEDTLALLNEVRSQALKQPGYISTWQTIEDWIRWEESDARATKEDQLENLQEGPADFEIYDQGPASKE